MNPGLTTRPVASISVVPRSATSLMLVMVDPSMPTSATAS